MNGAYCPNTFFSPYLVYKLQFTTHQPQVHFTEARGFSGKVEKILLSRRQWCGRVIFVESRVESQALRVRVIWIFFESSQSRDMTWSSRVRVESQNLSSHFESLVCQLESLSSQMKLNIVVIFRKKYFFIFLFYEEKWNENFFFFKWNFVFVKHHYIKCN